jgi:coatomer protein complex subunit alpha (xenin)
MAYQRNKDFARLSFLYLITGNTEKLSKMLRISEMRGDAESRFHNALYLGDAAERAKVLASAPGLAGLARFVASAHGLPAEAVPVPALTAEEAEAEEELAQVRQVEMQKACCLLPPVPIVRISESNWPLLHVTKGWAETLHAVSGEESKFSVAPETVEAGDEGAWGGDEPSSSAPGPASSGAGASDEPAIAGVDVTEGADVDAGAGWDSGESIEAVTALLDKQDSEKRKKAVAAASVGAPGKSGYYVPPTRGVGAGETWARASQLAGEHAAAGSAESMARLLSQQVGLGGMPDTVKAMAVRCYAGAFGVIPGIPGTPPITLPLFRDGNKPALAGAFGVAGLADRLKTAYGMFTKGAFAEAMSSFESILHSALLTVVPSRQEADEVRELIGICREYVCAIRLETRRRELVSAKDQPQRQVELAAYLTHCNLQLPHLALVLRAAMNSALTNKCHIAASQFARRLLDLSPKPDVAQTAQRVCQYADENSATPDSFVLKYDERNPFSVCCASLTPVYRGSPLVQCSYCHAPYLPEHANKVCLICAVGTVGKQDLPGLQSFRIAK